MLPVFYIGEDEIEAEYFFPHTYPVLILLFLWKHSPPNIKKQLLSQLNFLLKFVKSSDFLNQKCPAL
jgi:hypothetical protein